MAASPGYVPIGGTAWRSEYLERAGLHLEQAMRALSAANELLCAVENQFHGEPERARWTGLAYRITDRLRAGLRDDALIREADKGSEVGR